MALCPLVPCSLENSMIRTKRGFSLIDVMIAVTVTGVGVSATVCAVGETSKSSVVSAELTTAVNLAQQVHEFAMSLPHANPDGSLGKRTSSDPATFNDIYDLHNWNSIRVVNSSGAMMDGFGKWQQCVTVYGVDPDHPQTNLASPTRAGLKRVVAVIRHNGGVVHTESWFLAPTPK